MKSVRQLWLLLAASLLGATAGASLSLWTWPQDESAGTSTGAAGDERSALLLDSAFAPNASAGDLMQAARLAAEELADAFPQSPDARNILSQTRLDFPPSSHAANLSRGRLSEDVATARQMAVQTHLDVGRCYRREGRVDKAVEMLRKAAVLGPDNVPSRTELFAIYMQNGRDREALDVCRQLSRIEPNRGDHWLNLGLLRASFDDLDGARNAIKRALAIDPSNARYREAAQLLEKSE